MSSGLKTASVLLISLISLMPWPLAFAYSNSSQSGNQSSNQGCLQTVLKPFSQVQVISGQFEQQKSSPILSRPFVSNGRFLSVRNRGLLWETVKPASSRLLMIPGKMVQEVAGRKNVYQATGSAYDGLALLLPALLEGDEVLLHRYFSVDVRQSDKNSDNGWVLDLVPRSLKLTDLVQSVSVYGEAEALNKLELTGAGGDITRIRFDEVIMSNEAPDAAQLKPFEQDG